MVIYQFKTSTYVVTDLSLAQFRTTGEQLLSESIRKEVSYDSKPNQLC